MKSQIEKSTYAFTVDYLPILKGKFTDLLGSTNELEQIFIDYAFESYHLYLISTQNEESGDEVFTSKLSDLRKDIEKQSHAVMLHFRPLLREVKKSKMLELDKKLLTDILESYREFVHLIRQNQSIG